MTTSLLIGISGHRHIEAEQIPMLKENLISFFKGVEELAPNTSLKILTGMATGADQIAATVALELGHSVVVVLPMSLKKYETTGFTPESLSVLRSTLENESVETIELPGDFNSDAEHYVQLANYLASNSSILVAMWDTLDTGKPGGTSDVVSKQLAIDRPGKGECLKFTFKECAIHHDDDKKTDMEGTQLVYCIPVAQQGNAKSKSLSKPSYLYSLDGSSDLLYSETIPDSFKEALIDLDNYNCQYHEVTDATKQDVSKDSLKIKTKLDERHIGYEGLLLINNAFEKADALARENQKRSDNYFKMFSAMAMVMGFMFLVYAKLFASKILLIVYVGLFILGLFFYRKAKKRKSFQKHLVHRLIAEIMRVRYALYFVGIPASELNAQEKDIVYDTVRNSGVDHFTGFSFISFVLKSTSYKLLPFDYQCSEGDIQNVLDGWIKDQKKYYEEKYERLEHKHHRIEIVKKCLMFGSALSAVLLILFKIQLGDILLIEDISLKVLLVFLMGMLPFWLGVWELHQSRSAVKELIWSYRQQSKEFKRAISQIEKVSSVDWKREKIKELAKKTALENCLWALYRYHREFEPPTAG